MFLRGSDDRPIQTLDCGCGNAYFFDQALRRGSRCLGITIHEWEKHDCEEMRTFLGHAHEQLEFRLARLETLAADPRGQQRFD
jgi:hypothetical protein